MISGLISVVVSNYQYHAFTLKQEKIATAKKLLGHRFVLYDEACKPDSAKIAFSAAMSEAYIVFNGSDDVRNALEKLTINPSVENTAWIDLYEGMLNDVGIQYRNKIMLDRPIRMKC